MEKVEGWSVREVLGGGAEDEVEEDLGEDEFDPEERLGELNPDEGEEVESEGMVALRRIGCTQGMYKFQAFMVWPR